MTRKRLTVVVTRKLPEAVETRMRELFEVTLNETDQPMSPDALASAVAKADVLVPTVTDRIDQRLLAHAGENLKLIANYGAGFDHIDVETARRRGILVSNTPGVLTEDTADMTMALILAVPRRIKEGMALIQSGDWQGWSPTAIMG
ncbi:MAG TPA: D-glycerate dehydrogenase, partial [Thermohalobaculum sp.]|nr:D-glycerate dehydrogenase [Thermohalobaculum sp.]